VPSFPVVKSYTVQTVPTNLSGCTRKSPETAQLGGPWPHRRSRAQTGSSWLASWTFPQNQMLTQPIFQSGHFFADFEIINLSYLTFTKACEARQSQARFGFNVYSNTMSIMVKSPHRADALAEVVVVTSKS